MLGGIVATFNDDSFALRSVPFVVSLTVGLPNWWIGIQSSSKDRGLGIGLGLVNIL